MELPGRRKRGKPKEDYRKMLKLHADGGCN